MSLSRKGLPVLLFPGGSRVLSVRHTGNVRDLSGRGRRRGGSGPRGAWLGSCGSLYRLGWSPFVPSQYSPLPSSAGCPPPSLTTEQKGREKEEVLTLGKETQESGQRAHRDRDSSWLRVLGLWVLRSCKLLLSGGDSDRSLGGSGASPP